MSIVRLLRSGQVTLPTKIREALDLKAGTFLEVGLKGKSIVITPKKLTDKDEAKERIFSLVDKVWKKNKDINPDEVEALVEEAVKAVRKKQD